MPRARKVGLEYFPMDIDMFQDIRIRKLIKYQGGKAVTVYTLLLCIIYKEGYYMRWDEELPFIISEQTGFEEAYIQEVIQCCMKLGLLNEELYRKEKVLSSAGIQRRYKQICELARRAYDITEYRLIPAQECGINVQERAINVQECGIPAQESGITVYAGTQRKEKERKEKEREGARAPTPAPAQGLSFEDFREWMDTNTPELLEMKPPTVKGWNEVKMLYGSRDALEKACEEIAANEGFRKKWRYVAVALRKWYELGMRMAYSVGEASGCNAGVEGRDRVAAYNTTRGNPSGGNTMRSGAEERQKKAAEREAEYERREREAVTYEEWKAMSEKRND